MFPLKAEGHDEAEDTFEERLAIVQQLHVGRFVLKSTVMVRLSRVWRAVVRMVTLRSDGRCQW